MLFAFFESKDAKASTTAQTLLPEGRTWQVDNKWSVRVDRSHHDPESKHFHFIAKGEDVAVINQYGSPSHGSNPNAVPKWVRAWAKDKGLKESMLVEDAGTLVEGVPAKVVQDAVAHEDLMTAAIKASGVR